MAVYRVKLIKKQEVANETMAFYFERPSGFDFKAGQHILLTLPNLSEDDPKGNSRPLSIANAPYEPGIMVATRIRDTAFKRGLKNMAPGSEVQIEGPYGLNFLLHTDISRPAVFIVGGIGITPVRSIVFDATYRKLSHKIFLFYSNHTPEDAAFLEELQELQKLNPNYKLIATMTQIEKSQKKEGKYHTGYITKEMLSKYIKNFLEPIYYLVGPPQMVSDMVKMIADQGVKDVDIKTEEFSGY